jgi:hypothetical protein
LGQEDIRCPYCNEFHVESLHECVWYHGKWKACEQKLQELRQQNSMANVDRIKALEKELEAWSTAIHRP